MNNNKRKLTLTQAATYQIKVRGHLVRKWADWEMEVSTTTDSEGIQTSTLECTVDQAALHGLLRRIYNQGSPLISVICVEVK